MKTNKLIVIAVVVALILGGIAFIRTGGFGSFGGDELANAAPGTTLPIENYVPVVKYNGGIYSELPIQTTSDITSAGLFGTTLTGTTLALTGSSTVGTAFNATNGTSTLADVTQTSSATTTHKILSSSATQGGCVQVNATSTNTNIRLVFGVQSTTTSVGTFNGEVFWNYGTCE